MRHRGEERLIFIRLIGGEPISFSRRFNLVVLMNASHFWLSPKVTKRKAFYNATYLSQTGAKASSTTGQAV
jgi:hypothetical protein